MEKLGLQRHAEQVARRRTTLLYAPLLILPLALGAAFLHPLWGGVIMTTGSVLWIVAVSNNTALARRIADKQAQLRALERDRP